MKIKIINPNITQSMTDSVARLARRVARPDTQVWAVSLWGAKTIDRRPWITLWWGRKEQVQ